MKQKKVADFNSLLIYTRDLLRADQEIRIHYQNLYSDILVDEFQDINEIQWNIIKMLCAEDSRLFLVGDPNQSIYSFQGAKAEIIEKLIEDSRWKKVYLNVNYRSKEEIIKVANNFVGEEENLKHMTQNFLQATKEGGREVIIRKIDAEKIVSEVERLIENKQFRMKDIAILYRSNYISTWLEKHLVERRIPYEILGSYKFLERSEIRDVLAYLRVIVLKDDSSLLRTINLIKGIGAVTWEKIERECWLRNKKIIDYLESKEGERLKLDHEKKRVLRKFVDNLNNWARKIEEESGSLVGKINEILKSFDYWGYLSNLNEEREKNVEQLMNIAKEWEKEEHEEKKIKEKIIEFLNYLSMSFESKSEKKGELVTLSNIHQAKGLEFEVVFFVYLNKGIIPTARGMISEQGNKEEKRIFYVGITRAKELMYLTYNQGISPLLKMVENGKLRDN